MTSLVIVVVLLMVALAVLARLAPNLRSGAVGPVSYPYYARKALLTPAERSFLGVLEQAAAGRYRVLGKVRLADVLGVQKGTPAGERQRAVNRITAKHVDFVLCHSHNLSIAALVELDDASHQRGDRQARDAFLERACGAANLPLLRFPAQAGYPIAEVRAALATLDGPTPPPPSAPLRPTGRPGAGR